MIVVPAGYLLGDVRANSGTGLRLTWYSIRCMVGLNGVNIYSVFNGVTCVSGIKIVRI